MMEYLRSLQWADYYFFALTDPRRLAGLIKRGEGSPFLIGFTTVAASAIISIITFSLLGTPTHYFYNKITYGWIFSFLFSILILVMYASLVDFFCQVRGRSGSIKAILNLLNISLFPHTLILPAFFIFRFIDFAPVFFLVVFMLGLTIWQALIIILGLSEMHQMEFSEALISFLFPVLLFGVIGFFMTVLMLINLVHFITIA